MKNLDTWLKQASIKKNNVFVNEVLVERAYLFLFAIYMLYYGSYTTMFESHWPEKTLFSMQLLLGVVVFYKLVLLKDVKISQGILISVVLALFIVVRCNTGYGQLLDTALLIAGAYKIDFRKILKVYLGVSVPLIIYTIFAARLGLVTNLIYNQEGRIRESFGFIYPTDFAAHIFFFVVVWVLLRQIKCTFFELGIMVLITVFLDVYCDTRNSELGILLIVGCVTYLKIRNFIAEKKEGSYYPSKIVRWGCIISPFIFAPVMIFLCRFYNPDNSVMMFLNKVTTERLKLGKKTFDNYDTTLLGQYVQMLGNGSTTEKPADYTFIDCSYINILMRFGLLIFIVTLIILEVIMFRNINNVYILGLLMVICLHSVMEHHLFEFYYNFFIILPVASFDSVGNCNGIPKRKAGRIYKQFFVKAKDK